MAFQGIPRLRLPRPALYLLAVALCLAVRLLYVATSDPASLYTPWSTATDARVYDEFGWNLASRGILGVGSNPSGFSMPAYPLLLAGIYRLAGHLPGAARLVQAILGVLTVMALGRLARSLAGPRAEVLAVAAGAFYPYFLYFTGEILTECLFLFGFAGMLLTADRVGSRGRAADGVLHGVCLALAALTRPVGIFLEPAVLLLARPWSRQDRGRRLAGLLAGFLLFGAAWGGWIARNRAVFGETVLFDTHGGFALYLGHLISIGTSQDEIHEKMGYTHSWIAEGRLPGGPRGEYEADRRAGEKARESILADRGRFVRSFFRNVATLWVGLDFSEVAGATRKVGLTTLVGWAAYAPVLILGWAGLWRLFREKRWVPLLAFLGIFFITSAIHGVVLGGQRYRVATLDPLLLVLAAVAVDGWAGAWRRRALTVSPPSP